MTREDIIRMARENDWRPSMQRAALEIYDAAIRAEREACAKVCDNMVMYGPVAEVQQRYNKAYADCRDAICARGKK